MVADSGQLVEHEFFGETGPSGSVDEFNINLLVWFEIVWLNHSSRIFQGSKFKFEFGSTCATRCKFLGAQLKILGAQLIMLGASISKEKVKSLTVPRLFVIFSLLLLLQSCD